MDLVSMAASLRARERAQRAKDRRAFLLWLLAYHVAGWGAFEFVARFT